MNKIKMIRNILLYIFFIIHFYSITLYSQDHTDWSKNLGMYEVNVRQYTDEGTFNAFETHLPRLQDLGVGILWFMPIHPIGEKNRLGTLGSYYSVKDYYGINPEFGNLDDFKQLISKSHDMGFYVIIDWVANHTSWDNNLTISHPEWYVKDEDGNFISPPGTGWTDVIELDYSKQDLRDYMIGAMKYWINETNIDGFRCDAAGMVPMEFWEQAITELKQVKPDILMLAEGEGIEFQDAGFDATYAWYFCNLNNNGTLSNIINGSYYVANFLASDVKIDLNHYSDEHYRLYFTSNHDLNSWNGTVFERFGEAAESFAVLSLTIDEMPLIYSGQEAALNRRLAFFYKDLINWQPHPFFDMYKTLLELKKENSALWNGVYGGNPERVLTNNNPDIYAFLRESGSDKVFAVFNLTDSAQTVTPTDQYYQGTYVNVFSNDTITFTNSSQIELGSWDYKVFKQNSSITGVNEKKNLQNKFGLKQNYPNPFNPTTTIEYTILKQTDVTLNIYNSLGELVKILVDKQQSAGIHKVNFDGSRLASGIYLYRVNFENESLAKKMILIK